jgi:hypothetical protein
MAFGFGALMYYLVLYRSKLIPRWLSVWGVLGATLSLAATVLASFTHQVGVASVNTILNAPIGLQELAFAIWLIAKGFNLDAVKKLDEAR